MKNCLTIFFVLFLATAAFADTPPPGTVKAKMYTGDGNTALTATGSALNVNVTNSGGLSTVNQGNAGLDPWLMSIVNSSIPVTGTFWQATQPVSGTLTCNAGTGTLAVSGPLTDSQLRAAPVPVSGTITATNNANGATGSSVPANATQVGGVDGSGNLRALKVSSAGVLSVDGSAVTQPVSAASLPLPAGAASETTLSSINTKTPALGQALAAGSVPVVLTAAQLSTLTPYSTVTVDGTVTANAGTGTFTVDGSGHTQPVSGTVTANAGTGTFTVDASGFTVPVSGTFWQATQPVSGPLTDTQLRANAVPVSVASLPLPSGAATESTLSTLNTKVPALGQALAAGSVPVVLTASQLSTLTPLSSVTVSGTVTANAGTGTLSVDGSGHTQPVSGTFWQATQPVSIATAPVLVAGTAIIGKVGIDQTTPGTTNGVQVNAALPAGSNVIGHVIADSGSTTAVTSLPALPAGSNVIGHVIVDTAPSTAVTNAGTFAVQAAQSGTWTVQPGNTANTTAWLVNAVPKTAAAATVKQAAITIGTSAVRLTTDGSAPDATRVLLVAQLLSSSTANCYFGSSSVTTSSTTRGVQMFAGQSFSFNNDAGDYYAICDASSQTFYITEQE